MGADVGILPTLFFSGILPGLASCGGRLVSTPLVPRYARNEPPDRDPIRLRSFLASPVSDRSPRPLR